MNATYLAFAAAITLLIASPGPVVALVIADARRSWPACRKAPWKQPL